MDLVNKCCYSLNAASIAYSINRVTFSSLSSDAISGIVCEINQMSKRAPIPMVSRTT